MRTVTIQKPVVDLKATGAQIRRTSRRLRKRKLLTFALSRIGIKSQNHFTVYAWDRERRLKAGKMLRWSILSESPSSCAAKGGKSIPTIDNLLVLAHLFEKSVEEIVIQRMIEVEVSCVSNKIEKLCNKNCNDCKLRLSA